MTYSIVARDPKTGELGVAAATCWPAVGVVVPWVEAGVGAVATQAFTNVALGPGGLALLRQGRPAEDVVETLVAGDDGRNLRQLGVVDARGGSAAYTGSACVADAGHACGADVSVQGNMLEPPGLWAAMLEAFRVASGDLAGRLMTVLRTAEEAGGDIRGQRSAALVVVPGASEAQPWARRFDLRVDSAPDPIEDLAQLLRTARAHEALGAAIEAADTGDARAVLEGTAVAFGLEPDDPQVAFWHGIALAANGRPDEAQQLLERVFRAAPHLADFGRRFAAAGHGGVLKVALQGLSRSL